MKRFAGILLAVCMFALLASCSSAKPASLKNEIAAAELPAEQRSIVDLLSAPNLEFLIFDFSSDEAYSSVELWVEVYKDGVVTDHPAGLTMFSDNSKKQTGRLAIVVNETPHYQWTLSIINNGSRASQISTAEITVDPAIARAYGPIDDPVKIEDGKEIILYRSVFTMGNVNAYDCQTLQDRPELLKEYLFAHVIKCRFSK